MKQALTILAAFGVLLFNQPAFAWSGAGHMVIAAEAYHNLSPELKLKVNAMLKNHPDYPKWQAYSLADHSGLDKEAFIFMRSSTWPDEIHHSDNADSQYDHPQWHYVDWPLHPPAFALGAEPSPGDDVLFGIAQCEQVLTNSGSSPELKAVHLSYLIHLVADVHQPLHCVSFFGDAHPNGDKGGNEFYIAPAGKGIRLHAFWDGLLGTSFQPRAEMNEAIQYQAQYPRQYLPELGNNKTPKQWSLEGRLIAMDKAYLRGQLKGGTNQKSALPLPPGYTQMAKSVAERQAALAGYRLEDEIKKCLGQ